MFMALQNEVEPIVSWDTNLYTFICITFLWKPLEYIHLHGIKTYAVIRLDSCYGFQGSLLKSGLDIRVGSPSAWGALACSGSILAD